MGIYTFDTEFIDDGSTIDLISIGLINYETKESLYCVSSEYNQLKANRNAWLYTNVIQNLGTDERFTRSEIKNNILKFLDNDPSPKFYLNYGSYDWIVFCQLFGIMLDTPETFPYWWFEIQQELFNKGFTKEQLPKQSTTEHNVLADAQYNCLLLDLIFKKVTDSLSETLQDNKPISTYSRRNQGRHI